MLQLSQSNKTVMNEVIDNFMGYSLVVAKGLA